MLPFAGGLPLRVRFFVETTIIIVLNAEKSKRWNALKYLFFRRLSECA